MAQKKTGYREKMRRHVEAGLMPKAVRLLPRLELTGRGEVLIERHRGILEYTDERVLVLSGDIMLEIGGDSLKIAAMDRNHLKVTGKITGVRVIDA